MLPAEPDGFNVMLSSLAKASRRLLEPVTLQAHEVLPTRGRRPTHVYFPAGGVVALLLPLGGGATGLAALVGGEGMVGAEALLGSGSRVTNAVAVVQSPGPAWRLPAAQLKLELIRNFALRQRLTRYALALVGQMARTAACAREHGVEQQLARWLLQSWDRTASRILPWGAEGVAALLATERDATVAALANLERGGAVVAQESQLTLVDRTALEARACSCYAAMRQAELKAIAPSLWPDDVPPRPRDIAEPID